MESKFKTFVKAHLWLIILIGVLALGVSVFWTAGYFIERHQEKQTDAAVATTQTASNTAVNAAATSEQTAANASSDRQAEDTVRTRTIAPKLDQARRNSNSSRTRLDAARQSYNEKTLPSNSDRADDCVRLGRLFPGTEFDYCKN